MNVHSVFGSVNPPPITYSMWQDRNLLEIDIRQATHLSMKSSELFSVSINLVMTPPHTFGSIHLEKTGWVVNVVRKSESLSVVADIVTRRSDVLNMFAFCTSS